MDGATTLGPLSSEAALLTLEEQVSTAVDAGATAISGEEGLDRQESFFAPTILTEITPENLAYRQEFFGPVALFFSAEDDHGAARLANDSEFGLGCSIFTEDLNAGNGWRVASRAAWSHQPPDVDCRRSANRWHQDIGV